MTFHFLQQLLCQIKYIFKDIPFETELVKKPGQSHNFVVYIIPEKENNHHTTHKSSHPEVSSAIF